MTHGMVCAPKPEAVEAGCAALAGGGAARPAGRPLRHRGALTARLERAPTCGIVAPCRCRTAATVSRRIPPHSGKAKQ
jgi:hypothetical protein